MNGILKNGTTLNLQGENVKIIELLGSGGQGEVYKVQYKGKDYALKWYFSDSATSEQKKIILDLISKKSPNENFLWPISLIESNQHNSFGYIMDLRTKEYKFNEKKCFAIYCVWIFFSNSTFGSNRARRYCFSKR